MEQIKLITPKEAAERLRCTLNALYILKSKGNINYIKLGGRLLFKENHINDYINRNEYKKDELGGNIINYDQKRGKKGQERQYSY